MDSSPSLILDLDPSLVPRPLALLVPLTSVLLLLLSLLLPSIDHSRISRRDQLHPHTKRPLPSRLIPLLMNWMTTRRPIDPPSPPSPISFYGFPFLRGTNRSISPHS